MPMILRIENWPFLSPSRRTLQEEERWWAKCYLPDPLESVLRSHLEWTIVTGDAGSGKSTMLCALKRSEASTALILDDILTQKRGEAKEAQNPLLRIMRSSMVPANTPGRTAATWYQVPPSGDRRLPVPNRGGRRVARFR